jgi:hypothetical protein
MVMVAACASRSVLTSADTASFLTGNGDVRFELSDSSATFFSDFASSSSSSSSSASSSSFKRAEAPPGCLSSSRYRGGDPKRRRVEALNTAAASAKRPPPGPPGVPEEVGFWIEEDDNDDDARGAGDRPSEKSIPVKLLLFTTGEKEYDSDNEDFPALSSPPPPILPCGVALSHPLSMPRELLSPENPIGAGPRSSSSSTSRWCEI